MKLSLLVVDGKHAGHRIRVKGSKFSIGRSSDCDLRAKSSQVSRQHCVIEIEEQRVIVRDLGSRNGTFVNGEKIEKEQCLNNGDRVTVGRFELEARISDNGKAKGESSPPLAEEPEAATEVPSHAAGISGIALSIMESPAPPRDDDFELTGRTAGSGASADATDDQPTQSFTWPKDESGSTESEPSGAEGDFETAVDPDNPRGDPSKYVVSEAEKEKARTTRGIVGVSKSAQGKRVTGTSHEAAAEALRRFRG